MQRLQYRALFEPGPSQARLSHHYHSEYFDDFGRLQSSNFTDAHQQLDFSASYNSNGHFRVTAHAPNLPEETYDHYGSTPSARAAMPGPFVFAVPVRRAIRPK